MIGGQSGSVNFAEFMVHEFAAPNSNGKFSKSDVTAENATLPDETPVLQHRLDVHS